MFEVYFESTIRFACAAALTGLETDKLNLLKTTIEWRFFDITSGSLNVNLPLLNAHLQRKGLTAALANTIEGRFSHRIQVVNLYDFNVVKPLCHGHLGLSYIWASYARCIYEISGIDTEASRVLQGSEQLRFNASINCWSRMVFNNVCEFPN